VTCRNARPLPRSPIGTRDSSTELLVPSDAMLRISRSPLSWTERRCSFCLFTHSVRVLSEAPRQSATARKQRREIGSNVIWRARFCLLQRFFVLSFQPERPSILKYGSTLADSDRSRGIRFVRSNSAISICVQQRIGVAQRRCSSRDGMRVSLETVGALGSSIIDAA